MECLTGKMPYDGVSNFKVIAEVPIFEICYLRFDDEVMTNTLKPDPLPTWPDTLKKVLEDCWKRDLTRRPEMKEVCQVLKALNEE